MEKRKERLKELVAERTENRLARIRIEREVLAPFHTKDRDLSEEMKRIQKELLNEATETCGKLAPGSWDCEESPIDVCAYNLDDDPMCDQCVFCGQPDERK